MFAHPGYSAVRHRRKYEVNITFQEMLLDGYSLWFVTEQGI
jgi:hypothetical protein